MRRDVRTQPISGRSAVCPGPRRRLCASVLRWAEVTEASGRRWLRRARREATCAPVREEALWRLKKSRSEESRDLTLSLPCERRLVP